MNSQSHNIRALPVTAEEWDHTIEQFPLAHCLQSEAWAQLKSSFGWVAQRWAFESANGTRAAALLLSRRAGRLPVRVMYIPKGPLVDDWADEELIGAVLGHIEQIARRAGAVFVKIDPDVDWAPAPDFCAAEGERVTDLLTRRGWIPSAEHIQFRHTVLLDLRPSEDTLLANMKPKTRYNIRLASRRGVAVRAGTEEDLVLFYRLYVETSQRDNFLIRGYDYYQSAWSLFMQRDMGTLLLAELKGKPIAGVFVVAFGRRAWYLYGASANEGREHMPNYLLQWEAIRWARQRGCEVYDLWGAPDTLDESDPMWGVFRFKTGLGGQLVRHIGAWDYPISRPLYWLYAIALPRYLAFLRRRHRIIVPGP